MESVTCIREKHRPVVLGNKILMESHKWSSAQLCMSFHIETISQINLTALIYRTAL